MLARSQTKSNDDTDPKSHPQQTTKHSEEKSTSSTKINIDDKPSELIEGPQIEHDKNHYFQQKHLLIVN